MESIERLKLGLLFNFDPQWMGGIIYILNLIKTLNYLDDNEKPFLFLFYKPELQKFVDQVNYPFLSTIEYNFPKPYEGYIKSWVTRKNVSINELVKKFPLDCLYPLHDYPIKSSSRTKLVSWYADLQHLHYPEFFSRRKRLERILRIKYILKNSYDLVVSSQTVADDFRKFFKIRDGLRLHVFHFVSVVDDLNDLDIVKLRMKYEIPEKYFMISNQFHKHKNHKVLIDALAKLKNMNHIVHLLMTGRFHDASHSSYMMELHNTINEHDLHNQISFLDIIPRNEQLLLMKHAQAVLQPSLFEGWSTVIEDAISLQVPVIASSLSVNIEQLGSKGHYFEPYDSAKLAEILLSIPERNLYDVIYSDYESRIKNAAREFMSIFVDE